MSIQHLRCLLDPGSQNIDQRSHCGVLNSDHVARAIAGEHELPPLRSHTASVDRRQARMFARSCGLSKTVASVALALFAFSVVTCLSAKVKLGQLRRPSVRVPGCTSGSGHNPQGRFDPEGGVGAKG